MRRLVLLCIATAVSATMLVAPGSASALDATSPAANETVDAFIPTFTWDQSGCPAGATCKGPELLIGRCADVDPLDSSRLITACRGTGIRSYWGLWDGDYEDLTGITSLPWVSALSTDHARAPAKWNGDRYLWAGRTWHWQLSWQVYDPAQPEATRNYVRTTAPRAFSVRQRLATVRIAQANVSRSKHTFRLLITGRSNSMQRRYTAQVRVGTKTICTLRGSILNARVKSQGSYEHYADATRTLTTTCTVPSVYRGKRATVRLVAPIPGFASEITLRSIGAVR